MRVFIAGGTGLIGSQIIAQLVSRGDHPVVLTRSAGSVTQRLGFETVEVVQGDPNAPGPWQDSVDGADAVINLVGHNLFARRWTPEVKQKIRDSRVHSTEQLVSAVQRASKRPGVFVQGSAIGYYGPTGDQELTESSPPGTDFMGTTCVEWERAALPVSSDQTRLAIIRTGVVLAEGEGALGVMTPIFKWLPGGAAPVGSGSNPLLPGRGKQWISWIHLTDIAGLFLLGLAHDSADGPINGTAPHPSRNVDFSRELARVLRRPMLPIGPPDVVLRTVLGEVAQVVAKGQRVIPQKAGQLGYRFAFPELAVALNDLLGSGSKQQTATA